jgi:hypothetical protein
MDVVETPLVAVEVAGAEVTCRSPLMRWKLLQALVP